MNTLIEAVIYNSLQQNLSSDFYKLDIALL